MLQANLDAVVITEHDARWTTEESARLRQLFPNQRFYFAMEISAADGHLLAIGVPLSFDWRRGARLQHIACAIDNAGGCAVWVHPFRHQCRWIEPPTSVHAIEVFSNVTTGEPSALAQALAQGLGVRQVAGSDAHALDHLGTAWVEFERLPRDERQLADWIRAGYASPFHRPSSSPTTSHAARSYHR